ncbi:mandelate racemase/muconate lactonizing enzyme family protein [Phytoactinopolyspora limicola]|uniref:mandelate racemase/muconate lactonizing enzyme family protein n=1 Tax=Phytoactinopolyspora limicola TaxID=2715536 RepID=UPI001A9C673A|nr:enolase C-terminal domain-like protein [Phytoactinopolyspora limicola]
MSLKVTDVERIMINVPFRDRVKPWNELLVGQWGVIEIIKVSTNSPSIVGYGETLVHYTWQRVSDDAMAQVVGTNPAAHLGNDSLGAGLQMALYDVVGQALEVPMYRLLNNPKVRDWCPISWWNTKMPPELLAEEARDALVEGYMAHKIKVRPWFDVREQVEAISDVTPESYLIDLDWNGMLRTPAEALPVLRELDRWPRVGLFESPIQQNDVLGHAHLRGQLPRPLAEHFRADLFPVWMRDDSVDVFVVFGKGVTGLMRQGNLAASFNKGFWLQVVGSGLTTAFALHLGAVLSHATWPMVTGMNTLEDDLIAVPIEIAKGLARVPEAPGLGVTVDEAAMEKYRLGALDEVPIPRRILTFDLGDGRYRHYANMQQLWRDCRENRNVPVQASQTRLNLHDDDGSAGFAELHQRLRSNPEWGPRLDPGF